MSKFRDIASAILGSRRPTPFGAPPPKPFGLGGYQTYKVGDVKLDPRQKGGVSVFHAIPIEHNRYANNEAGRKLLKAWRRQNR